MSAYEPGTLAVATVRGVPNVRVMAGYGTAEPRLRWLTTDARLVDADDDGWYFDYQATDVRPLVVLDLNEPRALVADLNSAAYCDRDHGRMGRIDMLAQRIEAQTKPPKPTEPTGLGAVVEDAAGMRWVRTYLRYGTGWVSGDEESGYEAYSDIDAVRVLSEGVTQ